MNVVDVECKKKSCSFKLRHFSSLLQPDSIFMTHLPVRTIITARQQSCRKECFRVSWLPYSFGDISLVLTNANMFKLVYLGKCAVGLRLKGFLGCVFLSHRLNSNKSCDHCPSLFVVDHIICMNYINQY